MRSWAASADIDNHRFEYLTLSPLGLEVRGSYKGEKYMASEMSVALETAGGLIPLQGGGGSQNSKEHTFDSSWYTETPIDVSAATAVIVNGTRIPVK